MHDGWATHLRAMRREVALMNDDLIDLAKLFLILMVMGMVSQ